MAGQDPIKDRVPTWDETEDVIPTWDSTEDLSAPEEKNSSGSPSQDGLQGSQDGITVPSGGIEVPPKPLAGLGGVEEGTQDRMGVIGQSLERGPKPKNPLQDFESISAERVHLQRAQKMAESAANDGFGIRLGAGNLKKIQPEIDRRKSDVDSAFQELMPKVKAEASAFTRSLNAKDFTTKDVNGLPIADTEKLAEKAKERARELGMPEDGHAWKFLWNEAKDHVSYEIVRPRIEKKAKELYAEKYGTPDGIRVGTHELLKGVAPKGKDPLQADMEAVAASFGIEEKKAKAEASLTSFANERKEIESALAQEEFSKVLGGMTEEQYVASANEGYQTAINALNQTYAQNITPEGFAGDEMLFNAYKQQHELIDKQYNEAMSRMIDASVKTVAGANRRYNRAVQAKADEIQRGLNAELEKDFDKAGSVVQERMKSVYQQAYKDVAKNDEWAKRALDRNFASEFTLPYLSMVGSSIKAMGTSLGVQSMQVTGDFLENKYNIGSTEIEEWSDWFTDTRLALRSTGALAGSMTTSMVPALAVGAATGGLGAGVIGVSLAGGATAFLGETIDLSGRMYDDTFSETGDAALATERAKKTFDSQLMLSPTYSLEMLPFVGKFSGGLFKRFLKGAAMEYATETLLQEYPQNAFEEAIKADAELSEVYKYMTWEGLNKTAMNTVGVIPMGGGGQVYQVIQENQQSDLIDKNLEANAKSIVAKLKLGKMSESQTQESLLNIVANKGVAQADAVVAAMLSSGEITYEQAGKLLSDVKAAEEFVKKASDLNLDSRDAYVFTNMRMKLREKERIAEADQDPLTKGIKQKEANKLKKDLEDIFEGKDSRYVTLTYPNDSFNVLTYDEARKKIKQTGFADSFKDGEVKLEAFGSEAQNITQELAEIIERKPATEPVAQTQEVKPTFENVPIITRTAEEIETAKNEVFDNLNKLEIGSVIENSDGEIKVVTEKTTDKKGNQLIGIVTYERQEDGSLRQLTNIVWASKSADGKIKLDYNPHTTGTNSKGERVTVTDQITDKKIDLSKENVFTEDVNGNLIQINKVEQSLKEQSKQQPQSEPAKKDGKKPAEKAPAAPVQETVGEVAADRARVEEQLDRLREEYSEVDVFEVEEVERIANEIERLEAVLDTLPKEEIEALPEQDFTDEERAEAEEHRYAEFRSESAGLNVFNEIEQVFEPITIEEYESKMGKGMYRENRKFLRGLVTKEGGKQTIDTRQKPNNQMEEVDFFDPEDIIDFINTVAAERNIKGETQYAVPKERRARRAAAPKAPSGKEKVSTGDLLRGLAKKTEGSTEAETIAQRLRDKKIGGVSFVDPLFGAIGISKTLYDGALELAAKQVEKGTAIGKAIANAIRYIDERMAGKKWDKGLFGRHLNDQFKMTVNGKEVEVKRDLSEETLDVVNGWYSPLEKSIKDTKADSLTAKEWLDRVRSKEGEDMWTGLRGMLEEKDPKDRVSKRELLNYLKDNRVDIVEVVKGEGSGEKMTQWRIIDNNGNAMGASYDTKAEAEADVLDLFPNRNFSVEERDTAGGAGDMPRPLLNPTKFSSYQLEGEKTNYKEVLVTLPRTKEPTERERNEMAQIEYGKPYSELNFPQQYNIDQDISESKAKQKTDFRSTHFDEPNIVVHLRMNTRKDADGNSVLFLEEVQSDWGQKGKKEGFKDVQKQETLKSAAKSYRAVQKGFGMWADATTQQKKDELKRVQKQLSDNKISEQEFLQYVEEAGDFTALPSSGIPSAPFVTDTNSWAKLGFKVALKEAVAQGVDRISWTTGEQQNERYDLSKQVKKIEVEAVEEADGVHFVDIELSSGNTENIEVENGVIREGSYKGQSLEDVIGKEYAEKVLSTPRGETKTLEGNDLKLGGKGMKGFYGSPKDGSKGILGGVAEALTGQEVDGISLDTGDAKYDAEKYNGSQNISSIPGNDFIKKDDWIIKDKNGNFVWSEEGNLSKAEAIENFKETSEEAGTPVSEGSRVVTQPSITITPELKSAVEKGQPLFGSSVVSKVSTGDFLRGIAKEVGKGKIGKDVMMSGIPGFTQAWNAAIAAAEKSLEATAYVSDIVDFIVDHIRNSPQFKAMRKPQQKAYDLKGLVIKEMGVTEQQYNDARVEAAKGQGKKDVKEARAEERQKASEKIKTLRKSLNDKFRDFKKDLKDGIRKEGVKVEAKNQQDFAKQVKEIVQNAIAEAKAATPSFKVSPKQFSAAVGRLLAVNFNRPTSFEKAVEYVDKVLTDAVFAERHRQAVENVKKSKKFFSKPNVAVNHKDVLESIKRVDPDLVDNLEDFNAKVDDYYRSFLPVSNKNYKQGNTAEMQEYIDKVLDGADKKRSEMAAEAMLKELEELGVENVSIEEAREIYEAIINESILEETDEQAEQRKTWEEKMSIFANILKRALSQTPNDQLNGDFTPKDRREISELRNADVSIMDRETLSEYIRAVDNLIENGEVHGVYRLNAKVRGLNAAIEAKALTSGTSKMPIAEVRLLGHRIDYQNWVSSISDLFRTVFGYDSAKSALGTKVMVAMGLTDALSGYSKKYEYMKAHSERMAQFYKSLNMKAASEKGRLAEFVGIQLMQHSPGFDTIGESIANWRNLIEQHIDAISPYPNMKAEADLLSEVLSDFREAQTAEDIKQILKEKYPENAKVVDRLLSEVAKTRDLSKDHSEKFHNEHSSWDNPDYYPVQYKGAPRTEPGKVDDAIESNKPKAPKKSRRSIGRKKYKNLPKGLIFDTNVRGTLTRTVADEIGRIYTDAAWTQVNKFLSSPDVNEIFGDAMTAEVIKERLAELQKAHAGTSFDPSTLNRVLDSISKGARRLGAVFALGGVYQLAKQAPDQVHNAAVYLGPRAVPLIFKNFAPGTFASARPLMSLYPIGMRSATNAGTKYEKAIDMEMSSMERALSQGRVLAVREHAAKAGELVFAAMRESDSVAATASWLAGYEFYLNENGKELLDFSVEAELIETDNLRKEAAQFAENLVNETQGSSDVSQTAKLTRRSEGKGAGARNIVKTMFIPFSFTIMQHTSRHGQDMREVAMNRDRRGRAIRGVAGTLVSQGIFSTISNIILPAATWAGIGVLMKTFMGVKPDEDDDETAKKKAALQLKKTASQALTGTFVPQIGQVPSQVTVDGVNWAYYQIAAELGLDEIKDDKGKVIPFDKFSKDENLAPVWRYDVGGEWSLGGGHFDVVKKQWFKLLKAHDNIDKAAEMLESDNSEEARGLKNLMYFNAMMQYANTASVMDKDATATANKAAKEAMKWYESHSQKGVISKAQKKLEDEMTSYKDGVQKAFSKAVGNRYVEEKDYDLPSLSEDVVHNDYVKKFAKRHSELNPTDLPRISEKDIVRKHNIEVFRQKDTALSSVVLTKDGDGVTLTSPYEAAAKFHDNNKAMLTTKQEAVLTKFLESINDLNYLSDFNDKLRSIHMKRPIEKEK